MKTLLALAISLALCCTAQAQNFANTNTGELTASLPNTLLSSGQLTIGPTSNMLWLAGWRTVGFVQSPSNGWAVLGNYSIVPSSNGYCSLLVTGQYNLQVAADAALTNGANWITLSNEMSVYSNLVWKYSPGHNVQSLTNFLNTPQFVMDYYTAWVKTNPAVTSSNSVDFMTATWKLADIITAFGSSTNPPWRLIK